MEPRVCKLDDVLPLAAGVPRSTAPADLDRVLAAAPYCWAGQAGVGGAWAYGARRDVETARLIAARPAATGWRHLIGVRVDIAWDDGGGCDIPWQFLKRLPAATIHQELRRWALAGYEIRWGFEAEDGHVDSARDWMQRAMANKGRGFELAYYARADERDGKRILWLMAAGIDLALPEARAWLSSELLRHRSAARTVYGTPTDLLVPIKSQALCTPGWRLDPALVQWPIYLVGGYYTRAELAAYLREIFEPCGPQSIVTNRTLPQPIDPGFWGDEQPESVIGDGVFV